MKYIVYISILYTKYMNTVPIFMFYIYITESRLNCQLL